MNGIPTKSFLLGSILGVSPTLPAALMVDFNSLNLGGGPNNDAAFQAYNANHETAADFTTMTYATTFANVGGGGGAASVGVTPTWTDTTSNTVQQMIDRGAGNDANWMGPNLDLVTDWIGIDTRTGSGGNGDGMATSMDLTLSGLDAGQYEWTSFHHDTENVFTDFNVQISSDGGTTFQSVGNYYMSDSTPGGNPDSAAVAAGTYNGVGFTLDAATSTLPSTPNFFFDADGTSGVVLRFTPDAGSYDSAVHNQLWGLNGFILERVPEPSRALLLAFGGLALVARRRR